MRVLFTLTRLHKKNLIFKSGREMHRLDCGGSKSERNLWKSFFSRLLCDGTTCAQAHYEKNNKGGNITCKIIKYQR